LEAITTPDKRDPTFPKTNRTLRKHLERIRVNLIDYDITYPIGERTRDGYPISFRKGENSGSFDSFDSQTLGDKDLIGESNVNQSEANGKLQSFDSPPNPLKDNICELGERNEANLQALVELPVKLPGRFDHLPPNLRENLEEKAAILEFDGGLSREDAEIMALILAGEPT
jgi:hypothetical protein